MRFSTPRLSPRQWSGLALALGLLAVAGLLAGLGLLWQIEQAQAAYPGEHPALNLADNKGYGVTIDLTQYPPEQRREALEAMQLAGLRWLRQPVDWATLEPEPGRYQLDALDGAVDTASLYGFRLILVLQNSPAWARNPDTPPSTPPQEVTDFARFAEIIAQRYGRTVDHYQIWHEPNLSQNWGNQHVNPAGYALLLKNAALNIRASDPTAHILTAALAPNTFTGPLNLNESDYLRQLYAANAAPWFDILGAQLYGFHLPVEPVTLDPAVLNIHRVQYLREIMTASGDAHTPIWATGFGWNALPADWAGQPSPWPTDSAAKQSRRTAEAITYARQNWPWLGPMLAVRWDTQGLAEDDPARGFAINPAQLAPFSEAAQAQSAGLNVGNYPARQPGITFHGGWRFADEQADIPQPTTTLLGRTLHPTATLVFTGTRLDVDVQRGDFRGFLRVWVDGQPSPSLPQDENGHSYAILFDPDRQPATITLARHLEDGPHHVLIEAEGGWGQWAIGGWHVYREADTRTAQTWLVVWLLVSLVSAGGAVFSLAKSEWLLLRTIQGGWQKVFNRYRQLSLVQQSGFTFWAGVILLFLPGWSAWLGVFLLWLAIALRLETGLLWLTASISFFLYGKDLGLRSVSLVELSLGLVVAGVAWRLIVDGRLRPLLRPETWLQLLRAGRASDWAAVSLLAVGTLTTATAAYPGPALYEWRTVLLGSVLFYALLRVIPQLEATAPQPLPPLRLSLLLAVAFVGGASLHAGSALHQYFLRPEETITAQGVQRAIGYFYGSPNNLALFLGRAVPILLAFTLFAESRRQQALAGLGLLIVGGTLGATFSMAALVLTMPLVVAFIVLVRGGKRGWLAMGSGLILFAVTLIPVSRTARFQNAITFEPGGTAFYRVRLWQSSWQMLKEHLWLGVGPDNFLYQFRTRYILPSAWDEPGLSHPHNLLFDFWLRLGILGLGVLLWLQVQFWRGAIRLYRRLPTQNGQVLVLGLMGSMVAFLVHGLVDNSFFLVDLAYTFFFSLGLIELLQAALPDETA